MISTRSIFGSEIDTRSDFFPSFASRKALRFTNCPRSLQYSSYDSPATRVSTLRAERWRFHPSQGDIAKAFEVPSLPFLRPSFPSDTLHQRIFYWKASAEVDLILGGFDLLSEKHRLRFNESGVDGTCRVRKHKHRWKQRSLKLWNGTGRRPPERIHDRWSFRAKSSETVGASMIELRWHLIRRLGDVDFV